MPVPCALRIPPLAARSAISRSSAVLPIPARPRSTSTRSNSPAPRPADLSTAGPFAVGVRWVSGWGAGRGLLLARDQVAVAQRRDTRDDDGQRRRLAGQIRDPGLDVLAEKGTVRACPPRAGQGS